MENADLSTISQALQTIFEVQVFRKEDIWLFETPPSIEIRKWGNTLIENIFDG